MKRRVIGFLIGGGLGTGAFLLARHWWSSQNLEDLLPAPTIMPSVGTEKSAEDEHDHDHSQESSPRRAIKQRIHTANSRPTATFEEVSDDEETTAPTADAKNGETATPVAPLETEATISGEHSEEKSTSSDLKAK